MKVLAKAKNGKMLKLGTSEQDAKWYFLGEKVIKFAESLKSGKDGDMVDVKYTKSNGEYTITYITKGTGQAENEALVQEEGKFYCEDCKKELKDDKYKKCYACNQKNPTKKANGKGDFDQDTSVRQTVAHSVSRMLIALQGQVEVNNIADVFSTLFDEVYGKVKGE